MLTKYILTEKDMFQIFHSMRDPKGKWKILKDVLKDISLMIHE